ncbi:MAG: DNA adenine methylase [Anaerolineales bacterium]|nr:DNA adenine methylase [Anaerolineales bacterium]
MTHFLNEPQLALSFYDNHAGKPRSFAKPLLKWAGGKTQLLSQIEQKLPSDLETGQLTRYAEPFVGGGAVLFHLVRHYNISEIFISDQNPNLILAYRVVQQDAEQLIAELTKIQTEYYQLDEIQQKKFFYQVRRTFNQHQSHSISTQLGYDEIVQTARLFFLNRTCFNGLYRVNRAGKFNVPFGGYKNPKICDPENILAVSLVLQMAQIVHGDFVQSLSFADKYTFAYCDPPYRPLTKTASFNNYAKQGFDDRDQTRLASFACQLNQRGAKFMISNSDPHNEDPEDNFFVDLYQDFQIHKVSAKRMINSKSAGRGEISELLITNY